MAFIDHIRNCNRWQPSDFIDFRVGDERLGLVRRPFADDLARLGGDFRLAPDGLHWAEAPNGFDARTDAFHAICADLERRGLVSHLHGERYPVTPGNRAAARFLIDRACAPYFGVRAFGQHMNGYVRTADGLAMWVPRRSANRRVFPNHWDNTVAGGLPWGISLAANLRKECWEEASIPAELADRAVAVGAVSYCRDSDRGLKPDLMYCYDLELPATFVPRCNDDEVAAFHRWPIEQVIETVRDSDTFKLNCNLVIIDFLIRHGLISQDDPDYADLIQGLRAPLP